MSFRLTESLMVSANYCSMVFELSSPKTTSIISTSDKKSISFDLLALTFGLLVECITKYTGGNIVFFVISSLRDLNILSLKKFHKILSRGLPLPGITIQYTMTFVICIELFKTCLMLDVISFMKYIRSSLLSLNRIPSS